MMAQSLALPQSTPTLAVSAKAAERVALAAPLAHYIAKSYGDDPARYQNDLAAIDSLRNDSCIAATVTDPTHPATLATLVHYHHTVLPMLAAKFPINEENVKLFFTWSDVFSKNSKKATSSFDLGLERASILFNIGAVLSQLADREKRDTGDSLRKACGMFQNAAGCFHLIKDTFDCKSSLSCDLQSPTLETLEALMLAQAQEMFWCKAILDNMKDGIVAKLAIGAAQLYESAKKHATDAKVFSQDWIAFVHLKSNHMFAAAHYRKSKEALSNCKYGEEIGHLQGALSFCLKGLEMMKYAPSSLVQDVKNLQNLIQENIIRAEKDNDVIYMEIVPKIDAMTPIKPAVMVKANFQPETWLQPSYTTTTPTTMLAELVPLKVHQLASAYTEHKNQLVRSEIESLQDITAVLQATLSSLNLPLSIESIDRPAGLPESISVLSFKVRDMGGIREIDACIGKLSAIREKVHYNLDDAIKVMDDEEKEDEEMRVQFGDRWTRIPSRDLTGTLRETARVYLEKLGAARRSDHLVEKKLESHYSVISILSKSTDEMQASIPSVSKPDESQMVVINSLRQVLHQLNQIVMKRNKIIDSLKETSSLDDIGPMLAQMSIKQEEMNEETIFASQTQKYKDFKKEADQLLKSQESLLEQTINLNEKFTNWKKSNASIVRREQMLQSLESGYKMFTEIMANISEGTKFYNEFDAVITKFAMNVRDFSVTRSFDKKEFIAHLQRNAISAQRPPPSMPMPWDGNVVFSFSQNPPTSLPPAFYHPEGGQQKK